MPFSVKCFAWLQGMLVLAFSGAVLAGEIKLTPIKIGPSTYYFQGEAGMATANNKGFMSNAGFVVTDEGVVVFDALATPALGKSMREAIRNVTSKPVKIIIVSHYHADHFYGLQELKTAGTEIWAHKNEQATLNSDSTRERLKQRRTDLAPWVNDETTLLPADKWLSFEKGKVMPFSLGGKNFKIVDAGGAHSPGDLMLYAEEDGVLFAGDLFFTGRIPFVGNADSRAWLATMDELLKLEPKLVVPGHGPYSKEPTKDMQLTRDYLMFLRKEMAQAVEDMLSFEEAYQNVDWSQFKDYPAFTQANRINAYGTFLLMERESLANK